MLLKESPPQDFIRRTLLMIAGRNRPGKESNFTLGTAEGKLLHTLHWRLLDAGWISLYCTVIPLDMPSTLLRKHYIAPISSTDYLLIIAGRNRTLRWEQRRASSFILCIGYFWMQLMNALWLWATKENWTLRHLHIYSRLQPSQ